VQHAGGADIPRDVRAQPPKARTDGQRAAQDDGDPFDRIEVLREQGPHQHQAQFIQDQVVRIQVHDVGRKQPPPAPGCNGTAIIAPQCADIVAKTQHGRQQQQNQKQPNPTAAIPL
jgi:hypothetical protein